MRGRAAEYEAVLGLLASTAECRGKVLLVEGDPGTRKPLLLATAGREARERDFHLVAAVADELSQTTPLWNRLDRFTRSASAKTDVVHVATCLLDRSTRSGVLSSSDRVAGHAATRYFAQWKEGRAPAHSREADMTTRNADDRGWQLAFGLIAAWRAASDARRRSAVARRLAEAAKGEASTAEQAVLSLTALGNMFLELYADCSGYPVDSIIRDAVALRHDDPSG